MTHETYQNLVRVQQKKKRQSSARGNWSAAKDAIEEITRLDSEIAESISPIPPGHPDNPFLSNLNSTN